MRRTPMLDLVTTTQFRRDLKRILKRGYDLSKLDAMTVPCPPAVMARIWQRNAACSMWL